MDVGWRLWRRRHLLRFLLRLEDCCGFACLPEVEAAAAAEGRDMVKIVVDHGEYVEVGGGGASGYDGDVGL